MRALTLLFGLSLVAAAACSNPGRVATWEQGATKATAATSSAAASAAMTEAKGLWDKRDDKASLLAAIAAYEKIAETDAGNAEALVMLARAHYFLADGFLAVEGADPEEEFKVYQKGVDYGERALVLLEPGFGEAMRQEGAKFEVEIGKISDKGLPAAYWYAVNLGRFAAKKGLSARLFYKDKLKATMERIMALDSKYFYGAADRYFGAFYAILPSIAGKDLKKSETHFEAALKLGPEYLPNKVVKAQFLATERDDQAMYKSLLEEVLAASDTDNGDIAPENRAAKRTAKKMLDNMGEIF